MRERELCHCTPNFDVRCCCWVNDKTFDGCYQKVPTTYWRISNDYDLYTKIEEGGIVSIKNYIQTTCRINDDEWNNIVELYNNNN